LFVCQVISCEVRLQNDLYCVGWVVKLCSTQSNPEFNFQILTLDSDMLVPELNSVNSLSNFHTDMLKRNWKQYFVNKNTE